MLRVCWEWNEIRTDFKLVAWIYERTRTGGNLLLTNLEEVLLK